MMIPEIIPEALKADAKGYLSYSQTNEGFIQSLSLLAKGSVIVSSVASEKVQSRINEDMDNIGNISDREKEVAILVAQSGSLVNDCGPTIATVQKWGGYYSKITA